MSMRHYIKYLIRNLIVTQQHQGHLYTKCAFNLHMYIAKINTLSLAYTQGQIWNRNSQTAWIASFSKVLIGIFHDAC